MTEAAQSCVELVVPGLLPSHAAAIPARTPALETLLARSNRRSLPETDVCDWLFRRFAVARSGDWPAGALSLLGDGGQPADDIWLRADPVHLRVNRDQLILADQHLFTVSRDEAEAFVAALNRHFAADGLVFYPVRPGRWYVRVPALPAITTTPIATAIGRHIDSLLPNGPEALTWHRIFNEVQMLLHGLPANEARENRGELPVNSLWLWGAGTLPKNLQAPCSALAARDPLARGLALAANCTVMDADSHIRSWLDDDERGDLIVYEDALDTANAYGDEDAWSTGLARIESDLAVPLMEALRSRRIGSVHIITFGAKNAVRFDASSATLWRFWRAARPLTSFG